MCYDNGWHCVRDVLNVTKHGAVFIKIGVYVLSVCVSVTEDFAEATFDEREK